MTLSRRALTNGAGAAAAAILFSFCSAFAESAADDAVVLARAISVVLDARETHVVLAPVPPPRRRPKARPKTKGAKPAPRRMQLVLRDVTGRERAPAYEVFLVLEGPNVFQATTTRVQVGTLEGLNAASDRNSPDTIAFDVNDAFAKFSKVRGFNIRHLRVVLVRRDVKDERSKEKPAPTIPEIGAIELTRS